MKVLLLRPEKRGAEAVEELRRMGFDAVNVPVIRLVLLPGAPARALEALKLKPSHVVFTSPSGVELLVEALREAGALEEFRALIAGSRVAAVGPKTAEVLRSLLGLEVNVMPGEYRGAELASALIRDGASRVVLLRSAKGVKDLPEILEKNGVEVHDIPVYDVEFDDREAARAAELISSGAVDAVVFTSPSTVKAVARHVERVPEKLAVVAIGPTTAAKVKELLGVEPLVAEEYTLKGIAKTLRKISLGSGAA